MRSSGSTLPVRRTTTVRVGSCSTCCARCSAPDSPLFACGGLLSPDTDVRTSPAESRQAMTHTVFLVRSNQPTSRTSLTTLQSWSFYPPREDGRHGLICQASTVQADCPNSRHQPHRLGRVGVRRCHRACG